MKPAIIFNSVQQKDICDHFELVCLSASCFGLAAFFLVWGTLATPPVCMCTIRPWRIYKGVCFQGPVIHAPGCEYLLHYTPLFVHTSVCLYNCLPVYIQLSLPLLLTPGIQIARLFEPPSQNIGFDCKPTQTLLMGHQMCLMDTSSPDGIKSMG